MISVLQKQPKVINHPFPHFVIEDALPYEIYQQ